MNKKILLSVVSLSFLFSCEQAPQNNSDKLTVYTSFYPIYDFAKRIGKDKCEVINITPVGSEPHDYSPTTREVIGMSESDLVLVNGLGLENWTESLPENVSSKVKTVTEGIEASKIDGIVDPHVWLNPLNAVREMNNIADLLISIDNVNADYYRNNLKNATYLFNSLDKTFLETANSFTNKRIVVSHAAFGYLCDRYGLEQIFVDGISPDDEPTAKALEEVIANVKTYGITTVFAEELVSTSIAEKIARETGCKMEFLNPLEGLSENDLLYEDYVSVMIDNMSKLTTACKGNL